MEEATRAAACEKAREYLRTKGTLTPTGMVTERVGDAFAALETFLEAAPPELVRRRAWDGEWTIQEVADHVLETHRPGLDELRCLLAGQRPPGDAIPASLQSKAPHLRPWPWLLRELKNVHADIMAELRSVEPDFDTDARAPLVMVANATDERGERVVLEWVEDLDWKAYTITWRLHAIDHLHQARKVLGALLARPAVSP